MLKVSFFFLVAVEVVPLGGISAITPLANTRQCYYHKHFMHLTCITHACNKQPQSKSAPAIGITATAHPASPPLRHFCSFTFVSFSLRSIFFFYYFLDFFLFTRVLALILGPIGQRNSKQHCGYSLPSSQTLKQQTNYNVFVYTTHLPMLIVQLWPQTSSWNFPSEKQFF